MSPLALPFWLLTKCPRELTLANKELITGKCYCGDGFRLEKTVHTVKSCPEPTYPLWEWAGPQNHLPLGLGRAAGQGGWPEKSLLSGWKLWNMIPRTARLSTDGHLIRIPRPGFGRHMSQEVFMGQDAISHREGSGARASSVWSPDHSRKAHTQTLMLGKHHFTEPRAHPGWIRLRKGLGQVLPLLWVSVFLSAKWGAELREQVLETFWPLNSLSKKFWEWTLR